MKTARDRTILSVVFVMAIGVVVLTASCSDDKGSSTFGGNGRDASDERGPANPNTSSGLPCTPTQAQSAAAPVEHLCDGGAEDASEAGSCEDDLAACQRMCEELLKGYDYCGVDDGTDGGRVVRCTITAKTCD